MRRVLILTVLAGGAAGCSYLAGSRDVGATDMEAEANAGELRVRETKTRTALGHIETAIASFIKTEGKVPKKIDELVPKYLAEIPLADAPACGSETEKVWYYSADVLRGGQVDGTRIRGTGRWGYVFDSERVVVFVDCLKPSLKGIPWYQERGVY